MDSSLPDAAVVWTAAGEIGSSAATLSSEVAEIVAIVRVAAAMARVFRTVFFHGYNILSNKIKYMLGDLLPGVQNTGAFPSHNAV